MNSLSFYTTKELTRPDLINFCRTRLDVCEIEWDDDSVDKIPRSSGSLMAFIETSSATGQFPYRFDIYLRGLEVPMTMRREVELLGSLANDQQLEVLTATEEIDPYSYIHILPDGMAIEVDIKSGSDTENDELNIEGFYNLALGSFCTETVLSDLERAVLDALVSPVLKEFQYSHHDVDSMNNDFTHNRRNYEGLQHYRHFYVIKPVGMNSWRSKDEKADLLVRIMTSFYEQTKKDVCLFPSNSTRYENIPGGSDHESFCIAIDDCGAKRIVYKPLRKSW